MTDGMVAHYGDAGLRARLAAALVAAGHDLDSLTPEALSTVDEFHLGGIAATRALLEDLALPPGASVIDVGCGIGGPARTMARLAHLRVTGVDLTPEFVAAASWLTRLVGLHEEVAFRVGDGRALPAADASVDAALLLHVGMNIADKAALVAEMARVVRPGGVVAVYDIMWTGGDREQIRFPLPWASEPGHSFLEAPEVYVAALESANLRLEEPVDRSGLVADVIARGRAVAPPVHLGHLMGAGWAEMFANLVAALDAGFLAPIQLLGRR